MPAILGALVVFDLFFVYLFSSSGIAPDLIKKLENKTHVEERTADAELESKLKSAQARVVSECTESEKRFLKEFGDETDHFPDDLDRLVENYCNESTEAKTGESFKALRPYLLTVARRLWIKEVLSKTEKNFNLKAELDFLPTAVEFTVGQKNCSEISSVMDDAIKNGSTQALFYKLQCANIDCANKKQQCRDIPRLLEASAEKGYPDAYFLRSQISERDMKQRERDAWKAYRSGSILPHVSYPKMDFKMNRALAISYVLYYLETGYSLGYRDELNSCANLIFFEKWNYQGGNLDVSKLSKKDWAKIVTDWANKSSPNYDQKMFTRFVCEMVADPENREELLMTSQAPDINYPDGFNFCKEVKDNEFKSVCE
jgi:hypothetical protein